jgi:hypothetical protein
LNKRSFFFKEPPDRRTIGREKRNIKALESRTIEIFYNKNCLPPLWGASDETPG